MTEHKDKSSKRSFQKKKSRRSTPKVNKPSKAFAEKKVKPTSKGFTNDEPMRLNKYVAHCGICSRRQAGDHVKEGLVTVNGEVIREPGTLVNPGDKVTFKGKLILPETNAVYLLINKPKDVLTTMKDDRNRRTVMDLVANKVQERIFPVGRLDRATTGLLLLTNDGDLAKKLSHPSHKVRKFYQVTLDKPVTKRDMERIINGLELEDGRVEVDGLDYIRNKGKNEVGIEIHIGRNRIVRRIFEHLGYQVVKLDRTYYAGLTKKDLPRGWSRHLTEQEIIMLKHFTEGKG